MVEVYSCWWGICEWVLCMVMKNWRSCLLKMKIYEKGLLKSESKNYILIFVRWPQVLDFFSTIKGCSGMVVRAILVKSTDWIVSGSAGCGFPNRWWAELSIQDTLFLLGLLRRMVYDGCALSAGWNENQKNGLDCFSSFFRQSVVCSRDESGILFWRV